MNLENTPNTTNNGIKNAETTQINTLGEQTMFSNYIINRPDEITIYNRFEDEEFGISDTILQGIYSYGYEKPTPIQKIAIKQIMNGRDMVIQSQSGTGKTATFSIGILHLIDENLKKNQCIIVANTRELATQINGVFKSISEYTNIKSSLCIGGDNTHKYSNPTNISNSQVIIGCPGRICDYINKGIITTDNIKVLVMDEADEILSYGFREQIYFIFRQLPANVQTTIVSATIPPEMTDLIKDILKPDYISILINENELSLDGIKQYMIYLTESDKLQTLIEVYSVISIGQAIVYCNSIDKAEWLNCKLNENNNPSAVFHSGMDSAFRKSILSDFITGKYRIIVATDILARGIDIQQVSLVINYDMPKSPETFIHRSGRSGRFGRKGVTINFITKHEKSLLYSIENKYKIKIDHLPGDIEELKRI